MRVLGHEDWTAWPVRGDVVAPREPLVLHVSAEVVHHATVRIVALPVANALRDVPPWLPGMRTSSCFDSLLVGPALGRWGLRIGQDLAGIRSELCAVTTLGLLLKWRPVTGTGCENALYQFISSPVDHHLLLVVVQPEHAPPRIILRVPAESVLLDCYPLCST